MKRPRAFKRTRPTAPGGKATDESGVRIDTIVFIDLVILSLSLTSFALSCRSFSKSSTELQFWNCKARGFLDKVTPVFFSYRSKADSKSV